VAFFFHSRFLKGAAFTAAAAAALLVLATRFTVTTDLTVFTPPGETAKDRLLLNQLDQGATASLVFAAMEGAPAEQLRDANRALAEQLKNSGHFDSVQNGLPDFSGADLELLLRYRYLLGPPGAGERFGEAQLRDAMQQRLQGLMSPLGPLEKQFFRRDLGGDLLRLLTLFRDQGAAEEAGPRLLDGVWFSRDKARTLLLLEMRAGAFDPDAQHAAISALEREFAALKKNTPQLSLAVTGPGAFALETRREITADVRLLSFLAVLFTGVFLFLALGSLRMLGLALVPLVFGIAAATAAVLLVFGSIHGITLTFGITLIGVAVDYPLHLFSHLQGRARGAGHALRIWPTLRLGVLSTAIAYVVFLLSDFNGIRQLGLFAVTGLLSAAAATRWLLPLLLPAGFSPGKSLDRVHRALTKAARAAPRARWPVLLALAVCAGFLAVTERPLRNLDVDSLSPISPERRAEDRLLRADLGFWAGGRMLAVAGASAEQVLQKSEQLIPRLEKLRAENAVGHYLMAARYLPSAQAQQRKREALPDKATLAARIAGLGGDFPFKPGTFDPFVDDVEAARNLQPLTPGGLAGTSFARRLKPLLFQSGGQWIAPVLLFGVRDEHALAQLDASDGGADTVYLNLKKESARVITGAIDHTQGLLLWGVAAIYLLLAASQRSLTVPLRILLPTFASVLGVTAVLVASHTPLSLFHLVSLLLVIGLGLDYTLFFNRLNRHRGEWNHTFRALWICCVTTVLVFGILTLSTTPPLRAIGMTVALGAPFCLILGAVWSVAAKVDRIDAHPPQ